MFGRARAAAAAHPSLQPPTSMAASARGVFLRDGGSDPAPERAGAGSSSRLSSRMVLVEAMKS